MSKIVVAEPRVLEALLTGDGEHAIAMIDAGRFDPSERGENGCAALWWACHEGLEAAALHIIAYFVKRKVDSEGDGEKTPSPPETAMEVNGTADNGTTALIWACRNGLAAAALALLQVPGIDVNASWTYNGTTALWWSCKVGMTDVAMRIIGVDPAGIDVLTTDSKTGKSTLDVARASHASSSSSSSSSAGAIDDTVLKRLMEMGARHSGAALLAACRSRDEADALRLLVLEGIDTGATEAGAAASSGRNALWYAVRYSLEGVALRILEVAARTRIAARARSTVGGRPRPALGNSVLRKMVKAAKRINREATSALDVNATCHADGTTPLWWACEARCSGLSLPSVALELLDVPGIDVNARDEPHNATALYWACYWSLGDVAMKLLTDFDGIDVNVEHNGTRTAALHWACHNRLDDVAQYILRRPALLRSTKHKIVDSVHVNATCSKTGTTALWQACDKGLKDVALLILDYDLNPARRAGAGGAGAADPQQGKIDVDVNAKHSRSGLSTLDIARANGMEQVVLRLIEMGARHSGAALLAAIESGEGAAALALLSTKDVDVTEIDEDGRTTLYLACETTTASNVVQYRDLALRLLDNGGVKINARRRSDKTTALWCACKAGLDTVALALLQFQATSTATAGALTTTPAANFIPVNVNVRSKVDGTSPLFWACERGLSAIAVALLDVDGINVHAKQRARVEDDESVAKSTLDAAREHSVDVGGTLGPSVTARLVAMGARHSGAALLAAVEEADDVSEALRLLEIDGLDVNAKSHTAPYVDWGVLDIARERESLNVPRMGEVVNKLEHLGARYGGVALLAALAADSCDEAAALRVLAAEGEIDLGEVDASGRTTLYLACRAGFAEVATKLLAVVESRIASSSEMDIDARSSEDGTSALWCACNTGLHTVALSLLSPAMVAAVNVDVNTSSTLDGTTVLWQACEHGLDAVAHRLLDIGVDVAATDASSGKSALEISFERGLIATVTRLVEIKFPRRGRDFSAWCATRLRKAPDEATIASLLAAKVSRERVLLAAATLGSIELAEVCVNEHEAKGNIAVSGDGRDARTVGMQSARPDVAAYFGQLGTILGRYALDPVPPVHRSRTCVVRLAKDTADGGSVAVALKLMCNYDEFQREIATRELINYSNIVIGVYGWHTPAGVAVTANDGTRVHSFGQRSVSTESGAEHPYVLVMERGGQSLFIENVTQRIAGVNARTVSKLFRSMCYRVSSMHTLGLVHGDLKLRNIIRRFGEEEVCLCDLDAALAINSTRSCDIKSSSAYAAPELQASLRERQPLVALPSLDVWSLGVVLFELCTGRTLFAQDISNDKMIERNDETRLATWSCLKGDDLAELFTDEQAACSEEERSDARHLIGWCLRGDPDARPSLSDILAHRFTGGTTPPPEPSTRTVPVVHPSLVARIGETLEVVERSTNRVSYHLFISHAQIEASGDVGTLFYLLEQMGVHGWRDMNQDDLTEAGMCQGVYDSDVFVLFLTNSVLSRKFCQKELAWAITFEKPIFVVCEEEERFWPFDFERWRTNRCNKASTTKQVLTGLVTWEEGVPNGGLPFDQCPAFISEWMRIAVQEASQCDSADTRTPTPQKSWLPFRRRDFEAEALVREFVRRAGATHGLHWGAALPFSSGEEMAAVALPELAHACKVHFICHPTNSSGGDGDDGGVRSVGDRMRCEMTSHLLALSSHYGYPADRHITCTFTCGDSAADAALGFAAVDAATHIILVLTDTEMPSDAPWLREGTPAERELVHATRPVEDGGKSSEKFIVVYSKPRGIDSTVFAMKGVTSPQIQKLVWTHEALVFRGDVSESPLYEQTSMICEIANRLCKGSQETVTAHRTKTETVPSRRPSKKKKKK